MVQNYIQSNISIHGLEFHAIEFITDKLKKEVCEQLNHQLEVIHEVGIELPNMKIIVENKINQLVYSMVDDVAKEVMSEKRYEIRELAKTAVEKHFQELKENL